MDIQVKNKNDKKKIFHIQSTYILIKPIKKNPQCAYATVKPAATVIYCRVRHPDTL